MAVKRGAAWGSLLVLVFAGGMWVGMGGASTGERNAEGTALKATLDARQEVPRPKNVGASAKGSFVSTLVRKGTRGTLSWRLTFSGLTGRAVAAHVHLGKRGRPGKVVIALCGPCRSGARGSATPSAGTVAAILSGGAYVNVHTARNPAGEIRGQIRGGSSGTQPPTTTTTTSTTTTTDTGYNPYP